MGRSVCNCALYIVCTLCTYIYLSVGGTGHGAFAKLFDPGQINLVVGRPLLYKVSQYNPSTTNIMYTQRCTVVNNVVFALQFNQKDHKEVYICICYIYSFLNSFLITQKFPLRKIPESTDLKT